MRERVCVMEPLIGANVSKRLVSVSDNEWKAPRLADARSLLPKTSH